MSRRPPRFTLQGWLLAILLPILALLIAGFAVEVYVDLSGLALAGFDHKLIAVSSTTAAFVEPADHTRLIEPLPLGGLSRDPTDSHIWGIDTAEGTLLKIEPTSGLVLPTGIKLPAGTTNVASGNEKDVLFAVDGATGRTRRFSPATRATQDVFQLEPPITAVDTDSLHGQFYAAGRHLDRRDLQTGQTTRLREISEPYRDITFDTKRDVLWALESHGRELFELDHDDGHVLQRLKLTTEKPADAPEDWRPQPVELIAIVYDKTTDRLIGTSTSLMQIDPTSGTVSSKGFLPAFGQEQGPIYRRYAPAMSRIMRRTGLTFLYSQVIRGRDRITYGLDGTTGKSHSPLLSPDVLPEVEVPGIQRLMTEGTVHTTEIRRWQEWGLIKSAFAPIFDATGRPMAMVGADVDITTIQFRTRKALVITFGTGAAMIVLAGLLTFVIARHLTGPLAKINTAALHAAAGDYTRHARVSQPSELRELADRFSKASATLGGQMVELREHVSERRLARDRAALVRRLRQMPPLALTAPAGSPWAWGVVGSPGAETNAPGGAVIHDDAALAWLGRATGDALNDAVRCAEVAVVTEALLARHGADATALASALQELFTADIEAWALLTPNGAHILSRRSGLLFHRTVGGRFTAMGAAAFENPIRPNPGEAIVLSNGRDPAPDLSSSTATDAAGLLAAWTQRAPGAAGAFAVVITAPTQ